MKRAVSSLFASAALLACGDDSAPAPAGAGRFEAVQTAQADVDQVLRDTCDVALPADGAPRWEWPATSEPPAASAGRWTWVNVWATWCHPCLEEMPMLDRALRDSPVALQFVATAETTAAEVERTRSEKGLHAPMTRLADPNALATTFASAGLRAPASLPVHVLLDPAGKVRCVRAGAVEERHIQAVLSGLGQAARPRRIR